MKINLNLKKKPSIIGFDEETSKSVYKEFQEGHSWNRSCETETLPENLEILYADYTYENYFGDAYVLGYNTEKKKWFEVHGSHCSCYGLEGQWEEEYYDSEKQLIAVLKKRFEADKGFYRYADSSGEFKEWLEEESQ